MSVTLREAQQMIDAAIAKAQELDIRISVAVCDAGGRLVAFSRMDGAIWAGVYSSQDKAVIAVAFGRPSYEIRARAGSPIVMDVPADASEMVPMYGALPLIRDGVPIGACGVGGGTIHQDDICAVAAVEAVS